MLHKLKKVSEGVASKAKTGLSTVKNKTAKTDDKYLVALDIGTEFVKALIGKVKEDGVSVEIVGVGQSTSGLERHASRCYC
jgi:hypothetical protein